jgi:hypothetical protein
MGRAFRSLKAYRDAGTGDDETPNGDDRLTVSAK